MSINQRSRGRVQLGHRSVVPTIAGLPWWGVIGAAAVPIVLGVLIDSARGTDLTRVYGTLFFLGCLAAVLVAQNRALFTAMVQPPLLMVVVVPLTYWSYTDGPLGGIKGAILDLGLPLINRFPTMAVTTVLVWIIGAVRLVMYLQERRGVRAPRRPVPETARPARTAARSTVAAGARKPRQARQTRQAEPAATKAATTTATRPAPAAGRTGRGGAPRPTRRRTTESAALQPAVDAAPRRRESPAPADRGPRTADPVRADRSTPDSAATGSPTPPKRRRPSVGEVAGRDDHRGTSPRGVAAPTPTPASAPAPPRPGRTDTDGGAVMPHLPNVRYRN